MKEGKVFLTCGHEEPTKTVGWGLYTKEYNEFGRHCLAYGSYCVDCLAKQLREYPDETFFKYSDGYEALLAEDYKDD